MKNYFLIAALSTGLVLASGVSTVSADTGLLKLNAVQLDDVNAAGRYKKRHYKKPSARAYAMAESDALGRRTFADTSTWTVADSNGGYSGSGSYSKASASGVWCGVCRNGLAH